MAVQKGRYFRRFDRRLAATCGAGAPSSFQKAGADGHAVLDYGIDETANGPV
jgi:hypothetical protein